MQSDSVRSKWDKLCFSTQNLVTCFALLCFLITAAKRGLLCFHFQRKNNHRALRCFAFYSTQPRQACFALLFSEAEGSVLCFLTQIRRRVQHLDIRCYPTIAVHPTNLTCSVYFAVTNVQVKNLQGHRRLVLSVKPRLLDVLCIPHLKPGKQQVSFLLHSWPHFVLATGVS